MNHFNVPKSHPSFSTVRFGAPGGGRFFFLGGGSAENGQ